jgi:hypothetical protein
MRSLSNDVVEVIVIGAFAPSGRQTTPDISNANRENIQLYPEFSIWPLTTR